MATKLISLLSSLLLISGLPAPLSMAKNQARFSPGQIWAYKTRPQDQGSLIKIYRIETMEYGDKKVLAYHISMIGVSFGANGRNQQIGHLPVSKETLNKSVTKLVRNTRKFPDASAVDEGIAIWRKDKGGIFTISLAEIVDALDNSMPAEK